ncbi:MAG TPA: glycosyltransferase family 39 protein, partial [Thermomicrobiales bacterium]
MSDYVEDPAAGRPSSAPLMQRVGAAFGGAFGRPNTRPIATARAQTGPHFMRWERLALAGILTFSAALNLYGLANEGYANTYYAAAVRSMMESWHNFFFVSFDPGGFVTVDKPPLGFMIQTISAKIFGFHGWSILLPQALAGIASVALLYHLVRRTWGPTAGLIAAIALAVTPISVVTNRNNTIDSLLALTSLGAVWAVTKAIESVRHPLRWLLLAATFVGLGFNIKMLEAFLVLPALWLAYLIASRVRLFPRLGHLILATFVVGVVSLSWAVTVDLTPASQRPYIGSSQTNSVLELALGYNGLQRLLGRNGSLDTLLDTSATGGMMGGGGGGIGGVSENGAKGALRLLNEQLGGQIGWLVPVAIVGLFAAAWAVRPRRLRFWRFAINPNGAGLLRRRRASYVIWGTWFLTMGVFFSIAGFYHRYYLTMLSPGVAALAGIGVATLWATWRMRGWRGWPFWALPVALVGTALTQRQILTAYLEWSTRLTPAILMVSVVAAFSFVVARLLPRRNGCPALIATMSVRFALAGGILALLIAPTAWSVISMQAADRGRSSSLPVAGPATVGGMFGDGAPGQARGTSPGFAGALPNGGQDRRATAGQTARGDYVSDQGGTPGQPPIGMAPGGTQTGGFGGGREQVSNELQNWLVAHRGNAEYI